jgi:hypothetical protein
LGDITNLCSKDYIDKVSELECQTICTPSACCLPSAADSCFADSQDICKLYSPCEILTQGAVGSATLPILENYTTSGSNYTEMSGTPPSESFNESIPTVSSYCGTQMASGGSNASICSTVNCTTDDDCKGNTKYPSCIQDCRPDVSGSGSASDMGGVVNGSATNGSEYPSGMPPSEGFNNTSQMSGSGNSGMGSAPGTSGYGNISESGSGMGSAPGTSGYGNISESGSGMGSAPGTSGYGNMSGPGSGMGSAPGMNGYGNMSGPGSGMGSGNGFPGPSGMLPPEGFNGTLPVVYSYCGENSTSGSDSQPNCSSTICTSNGDCSKNRTFPVCLNTCGPSISSGASSSTNSSNSGKLRHPAT